MGTSVPLLADQVGYRAAGAQAGRPAAVVVPAAPVTPSAVSRSIVVVVLSLGSRQAAVGDDHVGALAGSFQRRRACLANALP